jgi:hypothetical protein
MVVVRERVGWVAARREDEPWISWALLANDVDFQSQTWPVSTKEMRCVLLAPMYILTNAGN